MVSYDTDYVDKSTVYILILTIPALPICWIKTYTYLSYFSMLGILLALIAMIGILSECFYFIGTGQDSTTEYKLIDISGMLGHIGVAMFVFEGNAVIMNVRSETKNKQKYPTILIVAIITTLSLFMIFAEVCYYTFKAESEDILTKNLPINGLGIFLRACVCMNALFSYPLQILAAFDIVEQHAIFKSGTPFA